MADKLEDFDWDERYSTHTSPLDVYLDGSVWKLTDEDRVALGLELGNNDEYYYAMQSLRTALYNRARLLGKSLRARKVEGDAIVVQAFQKEGE